jgi:hypothetical protein
MSIQEFRRKVEAYRLSSKEGDWQLPGAACPPPLSRTRFAGHGRPNLSRNMIEEEEQESSDASWSHHSSSDDEEEEEDFSADESENKSAKPESTRVILEVDALMATLGDNCRCMECQSKVQVELKTTCLATCIELTCTNPDCGYIYYSLPPAKVKSDNEDKRERTTDYAVNILYVLGFLCCGDGCTEAARILGLMGLPNDTTMEGRSFGIIEDKIGPSIRTLSQQILLENLVEEVKVTKCFADEADFERWKKATVDKSIIIHKLKYPKVRVSYDMAWQQRNSGNRYASPSGHALLIGGTTRRPVHLVVKSKLCSVCSTWKNKHKDSELQPPVPLHFCPRNHEGSSSSMEPIGCLEMVIAIHSFSTRNSYTESLPKRIPTRDSLNPTHGSARGSTQPRPLVLTINHDHSCWVTR